MAQNILSKTKAKEFKALASKKERDAKGMFIAEGEKCVLDMLDNIPLHSLLCTQNWLENHPQIQNSLSQKIFIADRRGMEIVSSLKSLPEVIAVFEKPLQKEFDTLTKPVYLLLDEIQDPGNLGTIIRTADWFGIYDIFASKNTVDVFSPKVVQATMGSLSRVKVYYTDLESLIIGNRDYKVVGTLLNGVPLNEVVFPEKTFIVMGNEGKGISDELRHRIDIPVTIPPSNLHAHPDSLNVSIATAIILSRL